MTHYPTVTRCLMCGQLIAKLGRKALEVDDLTKRHFCKTLIADKSNLSAIAELNQMARGEQ